jgi:hypothetical protein
MSQFDYNKTRADFERSAKGLNLNFEMLGGGYASKATACAWVGWCLRLQIEMEKNK